MYHPYLRGKQYELLCVRENAELLSQAGFIPIIEPVKESTSSLQRALEGVTRARGKAVVIANPMCGDFQGATELLDEFLSNLSQGVSVLTGILAGGNTQLAELQELIRRYSSRELVLVHAGFPDGKSLASLAETGSVAKHVFFERNHGKLYCGHFRGKDRVLVRDGFSKQRNADYVECEEFSELHVTFRDEGMDGFGDFLIVGDEYSESGGPAYAVAIHLTFIDDDQDGRMFAYHFVSNRTDTVADPAGKFGEALEKLVARVEEPNSKVLRTRAVEQFLELRRRQHFPGLGYVKKLSMQHHIETLHAYLSPR